MIRRFALRAMRDLLLIPLSAILIFYVVRLLPLPVPDTRYANAQATPEMLRTYAELGVGQGPLAFLAPWKLLAQDEPLGTGNLRYGRSEIARSFGNSLSIGVLGLVFALLIACAFALATSARPPAAVRQGLELVPTLVYGTPAFILALLVATQTSVASGDNELFIRVVAALVISVSPGIFLGVLLGDALRVESRKPFVLAARARGCSRSRALIFHALPNALPALLDAVPPVATALLAGSFVVERIFSLRYFGYVYVEWASTRQLAPVIVASTLYVALLILVSLMADLARLALDPRARAAELEEPS